MNLLNPKQILKLTEDRKSVLKGRDACYMLYKNYYFGDQDKGKIQTLAMNSQGRPLLRDMGEISETHKAYSSNRVPPVIDDYAAIIGRMPTSRVDPPDSSPQGEQKAEKLTKYLISTHELSDMDRQQAESGFYLSGLGDTVYLADPDSELKRPVWEVIDPQFCYPGFYGGYRRFKVYDLIVCCVWEASDINATFGDKVHVPYDATPEERTVIKYISPYQRTILVGADYENGKTKVAVHTEWDLGFCPAVWAKNKYNGAFASSDIANSIKQQDFLDFCMNVLADGLIQNTYPLVVVKDPEQVGDLTIGPGSTVPVTGTGDVQIRQTQGDIKSAMELIQVALSDFNATGGTSAVRQEGQMQGSIVTGKAVHAVQGPQSTRIDLKQQTMGDAIRLMNAYTLEMQEKAPHLGDHEVEIYGRLRGKAFREVIDPKKDIDGWYRNTVTFDELVGMNLPQKVQVGYEMMASGIADDLYSREIIGIEDPIGMRDRVAAMKMAQAQQEMQAQSMMGAGQQGPGGAPPGGGGPPQAGGAPPTAAGGAPGKQQQHPMQPLMSRASLPQGSPPPPTPLGSKGGIGAPTIDAVKTALKAIADSLHGTVYAIGNLALGGQGQVTVAITDYRDQSKVSAALKKIDPNARVKTIPEDKLPKEAERLV